MADKVLLLGDPRLREACEAVGDVRDPAFAAERRRLVEALEDFRARAGFGRGIAAPQIGVLKRFIAIDLGEGPRCLIDPRIAWRSETAFTLWDDCMSFPDLLVKVERSESVSVAYRDEEGRERLWERLGRAESELLQHELDHLDGVLAIDRARSVRDMIHRLAFEADRGRFERMVDYTIEPTVRRPA